MNPMATPERIRKGTSFQICRKGIGLFRMTSQHISSTDARIARNRAISDEGMGIFLTNRPMVPKMAMDRMINSLAFIWCMGFFLRITYY